jgi:hypothetical protein
MKESLVAVLLLSANGCAFGDNPVNIEPIGGANLAHNPGFESDPNADYATYGTASYSWATDAAHGGSRSIKIVSSQSSGALTRWFSNTSSVPAVAGRTYTFTAWIKSLSVTDHVNLAVDFWNASGTYLGSTCNSTDLTGTSDWTTRTATCTAPANSAFVRIEFRLFGSGTAWFDDVSLTDGASAPDAGGCSSGGDAGGIHDVVDAGSPPMDSGSTATPDASTPPAGSALETWEVNLSPNWVSPTDDPASNYNAVWVYPKSPTTPYRSPDSAHQQTRYLLLDPRATDAEGRTGNDDWWFVIERMWPSDYPANNHGGWGREVNFHNVAGDSGPGGGVGWGFGDGVSSLAIDWLNGSPAPQFTIEPNSPNHEYRLPAVSRDAWHSYVVHFIAGRTDGTTVHSGALTVWADGNDVPAIDLHNVNTVQRAQGPDGVWYVQRWMQLWEGDYTANLPVRARTQFVLTRIGRTYAEALADRPYAIANSAGGQYYRGTGVNVGAPTATQLPSRTTAQTRLPPSLH